MSTASAERLIGGAALSEVEPLWYQIELWPLFVDGLQSVVSVEGERPLPGSVVIWRTGQAGRGTVEETVAEYVPGEGQLLVVEDSAISGRQRVTFEQVDRGTLVGLELDYRLNRGGPLRALTDLLFIRRAQAESLRRTLAAFAALVEERS